jgi:hypothetical protein
VAPSLIPKKAGLVRARAAAKKDESRAKHRLVKYLRQQARGRAESQRTLLGARARARTEQLQRVGTTALVS